MQQSCMSNFVIPLDTPAIIEHNIYHYIDHAKGTFVSIRFNFENECSRQHLNNPAPNLLRPKSAVLR